MQAAAAQVQRAGANTGAVYTHQLPYSVRRDICNLIDADQSWRLLGGQFMHLDATQLRLVGLALFRNDSPTGELLNKLDSANVRIAELFSYLDQMGHCRATELLKPFVTYELRQQQLAGGPSNAPGAQPDRSLDTPTPSFSSIQPTAVMSSAEFNMIAPAVYHGHGPNPDEWTFVESQAGEPAQPPPPPQRCHNELQQQQQPSPPTGVSDQRQQQQQQQQLADPGAEIVRNACASNRKRTSISDQEVVNQLRLIMQIDYQELKQASNDFADSNILGNGGFASVYRGHWKGTDVAIKRLRCNLMDQALNELTILNSYRIDNILPIYGISIDGPEACLVYQFMANGSLEDRLSCKGNTAPLSWQQRAAIAEGVAKGLYYLHSLRDKPLVHGDAKSANVLLDAQFVPKLGDFGLARQVFRGKRPQTEHCTHCTVSSIHGTSVYLPPEYLRHKILSPAVDVYSYGIVMLELATGRRAYDGKRLLIDLVEDQLKAAPAGAAGQGAALEQLADRRLAQEGAGDGESRARFELLLWLGLNCAHRIKKKRPDIGQVLNHFAHSRHGQWAAAPRGPPAPNGQLQLDPAGPATSGLATNAASCATTTRTLTPELTGAHFAPAHAGQGSGLSRLTPRLQQNAALAVQTNSSAGQLMSVEEEGELIRQELNCNQQHQQHQQGNQAEANGNQIEAMIPLLTELGFSPQEGE